MRTNAVVSVIISGILMLIYIWIRFKDIKFGASAVLALCHDVLVVLAVYAIVRIPVGNTFIACMLTIVGYSINATIVIFDRIRENRKLMASSDLALIVNTSITQTFSRSINTSLTTFHYGIYALCARRFLDSGICPSADGRYCRRRLFLRMHYRFFVVFNDKEIFKEDKEK